MAAIPAPIDGIGIANLPNQVRLLTVAKETRISDAFNQNRGTRLSQNVVLTSPLWLLVSLILSNEIYGSLRHTLR